MKRVFGYGIDDPKKEHRKDKVPTKVEKEGDVKLGNAAFSVDKMTGNIVRTHDRDGISSKEKEKDIPIHPGELKCEGREEKYRIFLRVRGTHLEQPRAFVKIHSCAIFASMFRIAV